MEGLNKFKILTIVFLCMFVFVIAAIYTNTREVTENKTQVNQKVKNEQLSNDMNQSENAINQDNEEITNLSEKVDMLTRRMDEMTDKNSNSTRMNCRVEGILEADRIEPLSQDAAMQEAKMNNKELVLTCSVSQ